MTITMTSVSAAAAAPARTVRFALRTLDGAFAGWVRIDARDRARVLSRRWTANHREGRTSALMAGTRQPLHRFILGLAAEDRTVRVVHRNGDLLDCRRANLLVGSSHQARQYWAGVRARAAGGRDREEGD